MLKRILSVVLSVVMICSLLPAAVLADEGGSAVESSGTWGGIDWTLTVDGTLTIAPTAGEPVPDVNCGKEYEVGAWREAVIYNKKGVGIDIGGWPYNRAKVKKVVIEEGVISIGSFTFQEYTNLTDGKVVLPSTLTYIGQESLKKSAITKLTFAAGGTEELCVAHSALAGLLIEEIAFPADRPVHLHAWALGSNSKLKTATLPATVNRVWGTNHIDYESSPDVQANPSWANSSCIFSGSVNMESVTFGSEAVKNMFFSSENGYTSYNKGSYNGDCFEATFGLTSYCDLQAALNAAAADGGGEVTLVKTLTDDKYESDRSKIVIPAGVTLNFNNKSLTMNAGDNLINYGTIDLDGKTLTNKGGVVNYGIIGGEGGGTFNNTGVYSFGEGSSVGRGVSMSGNGVTKEIIAFTYGDENIAIPMGEVESGVSVSYAVTAGNCISVGTDGKVTVNDVGTADVTVMVGDPAELEKIFTVQILPRPVAIPAADSTAFTYNSNVQTYGLESTADYTVTGSTQTNAGTHTVTAALTDQAHTVWADGSAEDKEYTFVIAKAPVTVTADDLSVYVGSRPVLTYTAEGLMGEDTLRTEPVLTVDTDMQHIGAYTITVTGPVEEDNYTIAYVNGRLIVDERPVIPVVKPVYDVSIANNIIGGGAYVDKDSAYKGDTVILTIVPEEGYELSEIIIFDRYGNPITVTKISETEYSFEVTDFIDVDVTFVEKGAEAEEETKPEENVSVSVQQFVDVSEEQWHYDSIDYCTERGLMQGVSKEEFDPDGETTRAMLVMILWRLEGMPVVNYLMQFDDVSAESWYTEAVRWAASEKIVEGYGDSFGVGDAITREQFATILWRYAKSKGYDVGSGDLNDMSAFGDVVNVSDWAAAAMQWACEAGLVQGVENESGMNLKPQENATRAQAAALLQRYCENVIE